MNEQSILIDIIKNRGNCTSLSFKCADCSIHYECFSTTPISSAIRRYVTDSSNNIKLKHAIKLYIAKRYGTELDLLEYLV